MIETYLLLGSNLGDREQQLTEARAQISRQAGIVAAVSSVYETAAWGKKNQAPFLNQVLKIKTVLEPHHLLREIQTIELQMGRVRGEKWAERVVDIDILFYGEMVLQSATLSIPHPELHHRRFTLMPLAELAPELVHPVLGRTMRQLLFSCPDPLAVSFYSN